jgi:hypothetical protein
VCLGKATFNAVAVAAGHRPARSLAEAIEDASPFEIGNTKVWCQAHTGQQGTNYRNRNGLDQVAKDWARMAAASEGASSRPKLHAGERSDPAHRRSDL